MEIEPELRRGTEGLCEKPCSFGCDPSLPAHQLVDALNRDADVLRESDLSLAKGDEELLAEDLSRVCGNAVCRLHDLSSMPRRYHDSIAPS